MVPCYAEGGEDQEGPEGEVNAMEYEDQHHVQPEAKEEEFNLPEDMALDGEDHGDDEGNDVEEDEGGKEAGEDEQQGEGLRGLYLRLSEHLLFRLN